MDREHVFTSESLRRLQEILDQTCDDLGIARDSNFAATSREFLAKQLFRIECADRAPDSTREQLISLGRRYGLRGLPRRRRCRELTRLASAADRRSQSPWNSLKEL